MKFVPIIFFLFSIKLSLCQSKQEKQLFNSLTTYYKQASKCSDNHPFLNSQKYYKVIISGEKLLNLYPQTSYFPIVRKYMLTAIENIADIHIVKKYDIKNYMHFYANVNFTYIAQKDDLPTFISKYPNSKYTNIFRKIYNSPSEIDLKDNQYLPDTLYLVMIDQFYSLNNLNRKKFELLTKGYDIIHTFILQEANSQYFILVYRFFTDKTKALKALQKIKKNFPKAKLIATKPTKNTKILIPYERNTQFN